MFNGQMQYLKSPDEQPRKYDYGMSHRGIFTKATVVSGEAVVTNVYNFNYTKDGGINYTYTP